jgi:hypothetical protein|tara:strand:+ start:311 stop:706 length:396 start_codon:yes stop_codon:yes gene_type:complete
MVTIKPQAPVSVRTEKRLRRHGSEYDIVLEHFIDGKPAPMGLLCKSRKTNRYVWFSRSRIVTCHDAPEDKIPIPGLIEGIDTCTPDKQLLNEYLDHLMNNKLSKRDQKKFSQLYENVKAGQHNLIDRINNL